MRFPVVDMEVNKAVFLDKDGTLIRDIPYNVNPELIALSENMVDGLRGLIAAGYQLIVVSNQSGLAMGLFDYGKLLMAERKIRGLLAVWGIELRAFYYCPHHPQAIVKEYRKTCECRKPASGMLKSAAETHHIDLSLSWMVGDILDDIEAGNMAGCKTALIDNGNETEWKTNAKRVPDIIVSDINTASDYILQVSAHADI